MSQKIYKYVSNSDVYDRVTLADTDQFEQLYELTGKRVAENWTPMKFKFVPIGKEGDFPRFTGFLPVFSHRALSILSSLIDASVEALPLKLTGKPYYLINVFSVLDCLDLTKSQITWLDDDRILDIHRYVWKQRIVKNRPIFRIARHELSFVYVSEEFKTLVDNHQLEGLTLEEVKK